MCVFFFECCARVSLCVCNRISVRVRARLFFIQFRSAAQDHRIYCAANTHSDVNFEPKRLSENREIKIFIYNFLQRFARDLYIHTLTHSQLEQHNAFRSILKVSRFWHCVVVVAL